VRPASRGALADAVRARAPELARIGLETGPLRTWHWRAPRTLGPPVVCLDARHAKAALSIQPNGTGANDAHGLAQIVRAGRYREVAVESLASHRLRTLSWSRAQLVDTRRDLGTKVRDTLKTFGKVVGKVGGRAFEARVRALAAGEPGLEEAASALLAVREHLERQVEALEARILGFTKRSDPCRRSTTIPGVGALTAVSFVVARHRPIISAPLGATYLLARSQGVGPGQEGIMSRDTDKAAIVTGASRGIGAAIAERLAADGFTVVVNYAGRAAEAEALVAKIEAAGGRALPVQADVSDPVAVARLFDDAQAASGGVDVLVNNAGVMRLATIAESDDALFDAQVAINLKGVFNSLREAGRRLREGGRIINLSSSVVGLLQPTYGVYAATKAGVEAMTRVMAKELRGRNITVNAVAPGPTATALFLSGKSQAVVDHLAKLAPLERLGQPQDIAAAVAFLAGPDGAWINGQVLRANGGII
jgi:3-oxoacyl-[acyl-carrier protein] reductase